MVNNSAKVEVTASEDSCYANTIELVESNSVSLNECTILILVEVHSLGIEEVVNALAGRSSRCARLALITLITLVTLVARSTRSTRSTRCARFALITLITLVTLVTFFALLALCAESVVLGLYWTIASVLVPVAIITDGPRSTSCACVTLIALVTLFAILTVSKVERLTIAKCNGNTISIRSNVSNNATT